MSVQEPGLDRHEWESELASIEPELRDDPAHALPELADLVERILLERGHQLGEEVTSEGAEPEVVRQYRAARDVANRCELGDGADPGDVADAVDGLRALFDQLVVERSAP